MPRDVAAAITISWGSTSQVGRLQRLQSCLGARVPGGAGELREAPCPHLPRPESTRTRSRRRSWAASSLASHAPPLVPGSAIADRLVGTHTAFHFRLVADRSLGADGLRTARFSRQGLAERRPGLLNGPDVLAPTLGVCCLSLVFAWNSSNYLCLILPPPRPPPPRPSAHPHHSPPLCRHFLSFRADRVLECGKPNKIVAVCNSSQFSQPWPRACQANTEPVKNTTVSARTLAFA